jgi:hypothetical protein
MIWREFTPVSPHGDAAESPFLAGKDGELVSVRVCVEPRLLEELLETLAELPFPINPQIFHYSGAGARTQVEFPAYLSWLPQVRSALEGGGFPAGALEVRSMLAAIQATAAD